MGQAGACRLVVARATRATASGVMLVMELILRFQRNCPPNRWPILPRRWPAPRFGMDIKLVSRRATIQTGPAMTRTTIGAPNGGPEHIRIIRPTAAMQNADKVNADLREGRTMSPSAAPGGAIRPLVQMSGAGAKRA